tara:strand:- start:154 stop:510 length:357 start_codon:yes stop_codon:yes gene_type:complete
LKKSTILRILFCFGLLIISCAHNYEPTISSITADPNPVAPSGVVTLICNASDDDESNIFRDESLSYSWFAAFGEIEIGDEQHTVTWTAPEIPGIFSISCTVADQNNGLDIATVDIAVE